MMQFRDVGIECHWRWLLLMLSLLIQWQCHCDLFAAKQWGPWRPTMAQATIPTTNLVAAVADQAASFALTAPPSCCQWWGGGGKEEDADTTIKWRWGRRRQQQVAAMWSKMASDLVDSTRICGLKLHTAFIRVLGGLVCDFFAPKTNTQIHERTLRNIFFSDGVFCIFPPRLVI